MSRCLWLAPAQVLGKVRQRLGRQLVQTTLTVSGYLRVPACRPPQRCQHNTLTSTRASSTCQVAHRQCCKTHFSYISNISCKDETNLELSCQTHTRFNNYCNITVAQPTTYACPTAVYCCTICLQVQ